MLIRLPDPNVTAIVLSNNSSANAGLVARDLLALYFGQPYTVPVPRTIVPVDPKVFDQYVGQYQLRPDFIMTVTREGNGIFTQATGQGKIEVFPLSETRFFPKVMEAEITFVKGADGTVTHLLLTQGGRTQTAKKIS